MWDEKVVAAFNACVFGGLITGEIVLLYRHFVNNDGFNNMQQLASLLFESIPFAFPTHIIFRDWPGSALKASLRQFAVQWPWHINFPGSIEPFFSNPGWPRKKKTHRFLTHNGSWTHSVCLLA